MTAPILKTAPIFLPNPDPIHFKRSIEPAPTFRRPTINLYADQ